MEIVFYILIDYNVVIVKNKDIYYVYLNIKCDFEISKRRT